MAGATALLAPASLSANNTNAVEFNAGSPLPHKIAFAPFNTTYLNSASQHPISLGARAAVDRYLDYKSYSTNNDFSNIETYGNVLEQYANLINADVDEVTFVQSTTVGENLVLKALDIPKSGGSVVTDELHYVGSLPTYAQLAENGIEVTTLRASNDGRLQLDQFEQAITDATRLVSISLVSMVNGFQHELAEICRIAHAKGALVYADVVHAVGNQPFDVRESGVDFCSAASYKWLMGEQGLGFLYARKDRLRNIARPWYGHYQYSSNRSRGFPNREENEVVSEFEHVDGARGYFAMGSQANIIAALLEHSLAYLQQVGVEKIQVYRQPMIERLQEALPPLGYVSITPRNSTSALVSFRHNGDTEALRQRMNRAKITATIAPNYLRISPSVFNDLDDIERLISALK